MDHDTHSLRPEDKEPVSRRSRGHWEDFNGKNTSLATVDGAHETHPRRAEQSANRVSIDRGRWYTCVPFICHLWMGPAPAASAPSIWAWGVSSFDPPAGSQHSAPLASGVFPYPRGPPPPYFFVPPALSLDAPSPCAQVGWQTPGSSAPGCSGGPSRDASHLKTCQVLPSEQASRFSVWAPKLFCSPELCPLPPSPSTDPQPEPRCPRPPRAPPRALCRLFQL
ncbi:LOW QUALITY PROTEIN: proline-rich protein 23E [Megaptera novaeangliae]